MPDQSSLSPAASTISGHVSGLPDFAVSIRGLTELSPRRTLTVELYRPSDGRIARFPVICRIDTPTELAYFMNGGVLPYVLRHLARPSAAPAAAAAE